MTFSFAVGSKYGPRSGKWIIAPSGRDVYISNARRPHVKMSLHESGRWHTAFTNDGAPHGRDWQKIGLPSRFIHTSEAPHEGAHRSIVGARIYIPESCLRPAADPDHAVNPQHWLPRPPIGGMTVISVVLTPPDLPPDEEWPGHRMGTMVVGCYNFDDVHRMFVVRQAFTTLDPNVELILSHAPLDTRPRLVSPERRAIISGTCTDGALFMIEHAID